jgi:hypothetical protein
MVDVVMKMKFSINKCSHVFNRVSQCYGGLPKFIITDHYVGFPGEVVKDVTLVLLTFSFIELPVHHPRIELILDCSTLQFSGDLMAL